MLSNSTPESLSVKSRLVTLALQLLFIAAPFLLYTGAANALTPENPSEPKKEVSLQNPSSNRWGPPYPFTAEELQQKLMQVLRIPANDLSKEKVEEIFAMKFQNSGKLIPDSLNTGLGHKRFYSVYSKALVDWYFSLGMSVRPTISSFDFTWWAYNNTPEPYVVPMCIDTRKILKDIEVLNVGWIKDLPNPLMVSPHGIIPRHYFSRGKDERLYVDYLPGTTCMTAFDFSIKTTSGDSTE